MKEKPQNPTGTNLCLPFYFLKQKDALSIKDFVESEIKIGRKPDAPGYFIEYLFNKGTPLHVFSINSSSFDLGRLDSYQKAKRILGD